MDKLLKQRDDLVYELNALKFRAKQIDKKLFEINVNISMERYKANKREEEK